MGYVLAVEDLSGPEKSGYMRVYGPQYRTIEQAEQDAKLPRARGQRAEVWEVHAPADSRTGEVRGLDDARDAARWRKFNEVARRHFDSYTGSLRFYLPRDGLSFKTFEETIDSYITKDA